MKKFYTRNQVKRLLFGCSAFLVFASIYGVFFFSSENPSIVEPAEIAQSQNGKLSYSRKTRLIDRNVHDAIAEAYAHRPMTRATSEIELDYSVYAGYTTEQLISFFAKELEGVDFIDMSKQDALLPALLALLEKDSNAATELMLSSKLLNCNGFLSQAFANGLQQKMTMADYFVVLNKASLIDSKKNPSLLQKLVSVMGQYSTKEIDWDLMGKIYAKYPRGLSNWGFFDSFAQLNGIDSIQMVHNKFEFMSESHKDMAIARILAKVSETDPFAAIDSCLKMNNFLAQEYTAEILQNCVKLDPNKTALYIKELPADRMTTYLSNEILLTSMLANPLLKQALLDTVKECAPIMSLKNSEFNSIVTALVKNDQRVFADLVKVVPDSLNKNKLIQACIDQIFSQDPKLASQAVYDIKDTSAYPQAYAALQARDYSKNPDAVIEDLKKQPQDLQILASSQIVKRYTESNSQKAIDFISNNPAMFDILDQNSSSALTNAFAHYTYDDVDKSIEAASGLSDSHKNVVLPSIVKSWLSYEPTNAMQWVNSLPQGSVKNNCNLTVATYLESSNPELAEQWRKSMTPK
jgi:hypothetical protein